MSDSARHKLPWCKVNARYLEPSYVVLTASDKTTRRAPTLSRAAEPNQTSLAAALLANHPTTARRRAEHLQLQGQNTGPRVRCRREAGWRMAAGNRRSQRRWSSRRRGSWRRSARSSCSSPSPPSVASITSARYVRLRGWPEYYLPSVFLLTPPMGIVHADAQEERSEVALRGAPQGQRRYSIDFSPQMSEIYWTYEKKQNV